MTILHVTMIMLHVDTTFFGMQRAEVYPHSLTKYIGHYHSTNKHYYYIIHVTEQDVGLSF